MIYLIRHGQTDWNLEKKTQGHTDIPLNENGKKQAKELSERISNLKIDRIISSDLLRAKETAEIINKKFNKTISYDERIREINYGVLEGVSRDTLSQDVWNTFNTNPEELKAENKLHIYNRIKSFFDELSNTNTKENIIIVTHGGALRMMMYYAQNKSEFDNEKYLREFNNLKINNADIFQYGDDFRLYKKEDE